MMNKTKRTEVQNRNGSSTANRRPKRCNLCKKAFAYDKYNEHFEMCYRFQSKKIQQSRAKTNVKANPHKNVGVSVNNKLQRSQLIKKQSQNPEQVDTTSRFRIKNVSNVTPNIKYSNLSKVQKSTPKPNLERDKRQTQIKKQVQRPQISIKKQEIRESQNIHQTHSIITGNPRTNQIPNHSSFSIINQSNQSNGQQWPQHQSEDQLIGLENIHARQADSRQQRSSAEIDHMIEVNQRFQLPNQRPQPPRLIQTLFSNQIRQSQPQTEQEPYDIESVISNSNSIIEFIRGMNFMQEDETLSIMVAQLQQLNQIADQISQLNLLGRSLAFRMGNVFAARIHQLQTAIINQIGIALIRGFNDRLGSQFQSLTQNQPELKVGFSEQEIQQLFPQKMNIVEKECSICLQEMKRTHLVMELQCNHTFHPNCIKEWLISSKKCPLCRNVQRQKLDID